MSAVSRKFLTEYDPLKPFVWREKDNAERFICEFETYESKIDDIDFLKAKKLPIDDYNLVFHSNLQEDKLLKKDCLCTTISAPVVNLKTLKLLEEFCPNDFQAFKVYVKNNLENKKLSEYCNTDYFLINPLHHVDVLDHEKSKISYFGDGSDKKRISDIKHAVFNSGCMGEHHIVVDKHALVVFASRELAMLFNKHKITGVEFIPDDSFTSLMA